MMRVEAVIGANYGDEGKGMLAEHLCRTCSSPAVVLSNGGCQRGHTVHNYELGIRHVFHHFGSGTLLGAPSVYASTYLLNPIKHAEERRELAKLGIEPVAFRAPGCLLQLPSDMFTNQMLEMSRGNAKHGSCGWGIWETHVRSRQLGRMSFEDFAQMSRARKRAAMQDVLQWQLESRLENCKVDNTLLECLRSEEFIQHFIDDFEEMKESVEVLESDKLLEVSWRSHRLDVETLVVECGQGLLLDSAYAPADADGMKTVHATPSRCGMRGVLDALGDDSCEVTGNYVTRTYFTRHGAGPFPEETSGLKFNDMTNMPNPYQGTMKFGMMTDEHAKSLKCRVSEDASGMQWKIAATHCNETAPCKALKDFTSMFSHDDDSRHFKADRIVE